MERLSDKRVKEAVETGAEVLAISCPYEVSRFEDSVKLLGYEDKIIVRDIIELLDESTGGEGSI
jgi:Fe-S oxidoreductase